MGRKKKLTSQVLTTLYDFIVLYYDCNQIPPSYDDIIAASPDFTSTSSVDRAVRRLVEIGALELSGEKSKSRRIRVVGGSWMLNEMTRAKSWQAIKESFTKS